MKESGRVGSEKSKGGTPPERETQEAERQKRGSTEEECEEGGASKRS